MFKFSFTRLNGIDIESGKLPDCNFRLKVNDNILCYLRCELRVNLFDIVSEREVKCKVKNKNTLNLFREIDKYIQSVYDSKGRGTEYKPILDKRTEYNFYSVNENNELEILKDYKDYIMIDMFSSIKTTMKEILIKNNLNHMDFSCVVRISHSYNPIKTYFGCLDNTIKFDFETLDSGNSLTKRLETLEKLFYMPGSIGYEAAKEDFENLKNS
jgi:hypothetical protein